MIDVHVGIRFVKGVHYALDDPEIVAGIDGPEVDFRDLIGHCACQRQTQQHDCGQDEREHFLHKGILLFLY